MAKMAHGHPWLGTRISGRYRTAEEPDPHNLHGIYQQRKCREGKITIKEKFYTPTNPRTEAQQQNRGKFARAIRAWHILSPEEKKAWHKKSVGKNLYGISLFIREQMYG